MAKATIDSGSGSSALDVSGALELVHRLLDRYGFAAERRRQFECSAERIAARAADRNLYLAIVGEFSSGKSTFINALLRQELLKGGVIQGTTAAATFLRFAPSLPESIEVDFIDNTTMSPKRNGESFADLVHRVTTEERFAQRVARVRITCPSPSRYDDLVIIDTPGVNTENRRHAQVTEAIIQDSADAAIILTPAMQPLPATLLKFVRDNLTSVLHRCILLVTKTDLLATQDCERVIGNVRERYRQSFGLAEPEVLGISAGPVALKYSVRSEAAKELQFFGGAHEEFERQFWRVEDRCRQLLLAQRQVVLAEKLTQLLSALLTALRDDLAAMESDYCRRHADLEKNRIPDLDAFIAERVNRAIQRFERQTDTLADNYARQVVQAQDGVDSQIEKALASAGDPNRIKEVASGKAAAFCGEAYANLCQNLNGSSGLAIQRANQLLHEFESEFQEFYRALTPLDAEIAAPHHGLNVPALQASSLDNHLDPLRRVLEAEEKREEKWAGGAGATGAGIGLALGGPLGAALGFLAGAVTGALIGQNIGLDKFREQCRQKLLSATRAAFFEARNSGRNVLKDYVALVQKQLEQTIRKYFEHYGGVVADLQRADTKAATELNLARERIKLDLETINKRIELLVHTREQLKATS